MTPVIHFISFSSLSILFSDDQFQARPNIVHSTDLDVNKSERERHLSYGVFGDVGRDFR